MPYNIPKSNMSYLPGSYADLPAAVLECVFSYLKVTELFQVAQVCTTWQTVSNHTHIWFRKMNQLDIGYHIRKDLKSKLLGSQVDQGDTVRLLQCICLYYGCPTYSSFPDPGESAGVRKKSKHRLYEDDALTLQLYLGGSAKTMKHLDYWGVKEEDILIASVLLFDRTPSEVYLSVRSDPSSIRGIGVFLLLLSNRPCDISFKDLYCWINSCSSSNQLLEQLNACKRCKVKELCVAVSTIDILPTTVESLTLSLMMGPTSSRTAMDPGLAHLTQRCPQLEHLGVHVRSGMETKNLPCLPDMQYGPFLYLSQLTEDHLQWAVDTLITLQPPRGYNSVKLLSCGLHVDQLCDLVGRLAAAGVTISGIGLYVSSQHSYREMRQLYTVTCDTLQCELFWYQDDDALDSNKEIEYIIKSSESEY